MRIIKPSFEIWDQEEGLEDEFIKIIEVLNIKYYLKIL